MLGVRRLARGTIVALPVLLQRCHCKLLTIHRARVCACALPQHRFEFRSPSSGAPAAHVALRAAMDGWAADDPLAKLPLPGAGDGDSSDGEDTSVPRVFRLDRMVPAEGTEYVFVIDEATEIHATDRPSRMSASDDSVVPSDAVDPRDVAAVRRRVNYVSQITSHCTCRPCWA